VTGSNNAAQKRKQENLQKTKPEDINSGEQGLWRGIKSVTEKSSKAKMLWFVKMLLKVTKNP